MYALSIWIVKSAKDLYNSDIMKRKSKSSLAARADRSIRTKAYEYIHGLIVSGELADNAISELAIAQELGNSRTPIREAIGQLLAEGLLERLQTTAQR